MTLQTTDLDTTGIDAGWQDIIATETARPYMRELSGFLAARRALQAVIYPPAPDILNALRLTPFADIRVVILGQDPYHGAGQAHGLSFSVPAGIKLPPSLRNIYKEIARDFGQVPPAHGDLSSWAQQGVLLLNATLTVEDGKAGAHQNRGWEIFTDSLIKSVSDKKQHVVFMLWGSYAQKKAALIDRQKHLVLEAPHPSPLSAHRGFIGCGHFSAANRYLSQHGLNDIKWV